MNRFTQIMARTARTAALVMAGTILLVAPARAFDGSFAAGGGNQTGIRLGQSTGYSYYYPRYSAASPTVEYSRSYASTPTTITAQSPSGLTLTNQWYEPGDGWRYPLYFSSSTRTLYYFPAQPVPVTASGLRPAQR
jgi:hypothetical protein